MSGCVSTVHKTLIISNALAIMGHKPIQTLLNGDDLTVSAEQAFDLLLPSVLTKTPWRFATRIEQLTKLNETPPSNMWKFVYSLPAGYLKTIRMHPQTYAWEIFEGNKIYANFDGEWYMEYVLLPSIQYLPAYFIEYFVYEIATYLALSNAQKPEFYQVLDAKRIQLQAFAAATDSQNRPSSSQIIFPVLSNRDTAGSEYSFN